jgi:WD40 repeat protein
MIAEVEGERGALPMMAFAVHRLWEERDREERLLTQLAYEEIGGVAGALAKHAEASLERIGYERLPIVRELFRNLVTAEGTRATREVEDLLSVFDNERRPVADEVLRELIDARLLTSYRIDDEDGPLRRVEIIHESLLASWPRLVRWQTQDADAALLRDQLRQAARTWNERGRSRDLLWTGKAFREFDLWRESYPGGLSELEKDFAEAMTSHAKRRQRLRRFVGAAVFVILLIVLGIVGVSRQQAVAGAKRAEAAKLVALGQLRLEDYPTAAVAHAIASLELADTTEARWLALRALWEGPTTMIVNDDPTVVTEFSPDGNLLSQSIFDHYENQLRIVAIDGETKVLDHLFPFSVIFQTMNPAGTVVFSEANHAPFRVVLWSLPDGRKLVDADMTHAPNRHFSWAYGWNEGQFLGLVPDGELDSIDAFKFDGTVERLGTVDFGGGQVKGRHFRRAIDLRTGRWLAAVEKDTVSVVEIGPNGLGAPKVLGRHRGTGHRIAVDPEGRFVVTSNAEGLIKIWDPISSSPPIRIQGPNAIDRVGLFGRDPRLVVRASEDGTGKVWVYSFAAGAHRLLRVFDSVPTHAGWFYAYQPWGWDPSGRRFVRNGPKQVTRMWSLSTPADSEPMSLRRGEVTWDWYHSFHPNGHWLATGDGSGLRLWPLSRSYPAVIRAHEDKVFAVRFAPNGQWIASGGWDGVVRLTPLDGEVPAPSREVVRDFGDVQRIAVSPHGRNLIGCSSAIGCYLLPIDGSSPIHLGDIVTGFGVSYSSNGQWAAITGLDPDGRQVLQILRSSEVERTIASDPEDPESGVNPRILNDGRILYARESGLHILDPTNGESELVYEGICPEYEISEDEQRIVLVTTPDLDPISVGPAVLLDLEAETQTQLTGHGDEVWYVTMDGSGTMVATGDLDGVLRVSHVSGGEPHVLLGHEGGIYAIDIDPLGRWIATGGQDGTVRIWPMPDLSKPPLHTLPRNELIAKLKTLTNLRVNRDEEDPSGWTLTHDPFPGWETVPTW